jgi:two-component system, NtrC family, C4-dicarboxylate transport sensor histidine kinase DctB
MTRPREEQARSALLLAANRAALYGTVSRWLIHDLRGPAQALSLVSDLLEQGDNLDEPSVRLSLLEASERLRELLDLLDQVLRRPDPDDEPRPIVLREPIALAATLLRLQRSNVTLDAEQALEASLPAARGVDDQVQHALMSVLVNAYEALARQGGGTVRVTADASDAVVRIAVTDDGPGVAPELAAGLFEPFVTTKNGRPLAGLGLWAARTLLDRAGGQVRYEPAGSGARFVLELPVWR